MAEEKKPKLNLLDFPIIFAIAVVGVLLFVMNLVNETTNPTPPKSDTIMVVKDTPQVDSLKVDTLKLK